MSTANVNANSITPSADGAKHLAAGQHLSLRLWENEEPGEPKPLSNKPYETVGYVLKGRAELHLEGQVIALEPGASYLVPQGASHTYNILETFSAIEATSPAQTGE
jgi:quercetin dioxygenase-like cupin family protein